MTRVNLLKQNRSSFYRNNQSGQRELRPAGVRTTRKVERVLNCGKRGSQPWHLLILATRTTSHGLYLGA